MLWSAFLLGFFGSFHCLGMCVPIVFAFQKQKNAFFFKVIYNLGRLSTYMLLGALVGSLGNALAFAGVQQWLASFSGLMMILVGLFAVNLDTVLLKLPKIQRLFGWVSQQMGKAMQKKNSTFLIGMLNGILPCGLVYFALFGATASGNIIEGMTYMGAFGLGTFPLMVGTALLGQIVQLKWRNVFKKLYPALFIFLGILVLYKSLNLQLVQGRAANNSVICAPF